MEDSLWCQHIPVEGVVLRPELRHLSRWQIHRDRIWGQEGHGLRSDLLERTEAPALLQHLNFTLPPRPPTFHLWTTDYRFGKLSVEIGMPKDACAGKKLTLVLSFLFRRVYFWVTLFCDFWIFFCFSLRIFGCNPTKQRFISENLVPQTFCEKCTYRIK